MTIVEPARLITGGVDTHLDTHVAAALDANGGVLGVESFATTPAGLEALHVWLSGFGPWSASEWKAPAPTAQDGLVICAATASR